MAHKNIAKKQIGRREFLRTAAFTTGGLMLAACGTPAATTNTAAPTQAPAAAEIVPTQAVASAELIELTTMSPDRELGRKVDKIAIDTFNKNMEEQGKPFRMKENVGPATDNDFLTKITVDASAGTLADVVNLGSSWVADLAASNALLDLTDRVNAWPDFQKIYPVVRESSAINGKYWTLPGGASTFTFFYRKDVLDKAGISTEQPKTWDEFYTACESIATKASIKPVCLPGATAWGGGTWEEGFRQVLLSFKGPVYDTTDSKWVVSSPNLLKAFQVYETLVKNNWLTVDELMNPNPWEATKYQAFPAGELAVVTGGDWQWTFDWGLDGATPIEGLFEKVARWQYPTEEGQPYVFVGTGGGAAISAKTKSPDGAWEYLQTIGNNSVACEQLPIYLGGPSGRDDFAEACPAYKTAVNGKMFEASQTFSSGRFLRSYTGESKWSDGIARATEDIITMKKTPEEAMADFAQAMKESIGPEAVKEA